MSNRYGYALVCLGLLAQLILAACGEDDRPIIVQRDTPLATNLPPTATPTSGLLALAATPTPAPVKDELFIDFDPGQPGTDISPLIYGLAGSDEAHDPNYITGLRPGLLRWGGNPSSRYNWVLGNAWNTGRDGDFRNTSYDNPDSKDVAGDAVAQTRRNNIPFLLTIPTIGWVAKNSDINTRSLNVPSTGGLPIAPGSEEIEGYNPSSNRALTSVRSQARKNAPFVLKPDPKSPVVYQDEWVASLVARFGKANQGGVRFYAMDNEPDIWSTTHTDVHPARMGYDDILARFVEYASAVKAVDPTSQISGPVVWGWNSYFWSELDRGSDNFKTALDRRNHGNVPFLAWFLDQLRQYEQKNGLRLLDLLDIHYYPQAEGVYNGTTDSKTAALRLRSTRSLWNNNYVDESWIGSQVRLIPRMREWIDAYYPGTRLAITEWNFGADQTMNGALAISLALGAFGREGVYMAAYWRYPPAKSPGYYAFKLYTNFDDKGSSFGDKSIPVRVSDDLKVGSFAAIDSKTGRIRLILLNLQPDKPQNVAVRPAKSLPKQSAPVYRLSAETGNLLAQVEPLELVSGARFELTLPAYSATLLDLSPPATGDGKTP